MCKRRRSADNRRLFHTSGKRNGSMGTVLDVRNQIAHGALLSARIDMARVIEDFFRIQASPAQE